MNFRADPLSRGLSARKVGVNNLEELVQFFNAMLVGKHNSGSLERLWRR